MKRIDTNPQDALAGLLFLSIAMACAFFADNLQMGTSMSMGPGYIPVLLSAVMGSIALLVIFSVMNVGRNGPVFKIAIVMLMLIAGLILVVANAAHFETFLTMRARWGAGVVFGAGALLVSLGSLMIVLPIIVDHGTTEPIAWRAVIVLTAAVGFFGLFLNDLGLVPTLFVSVALSTFAGGTMKVTARIATTIMIVAACWLIFIKGVGLPIPSFALWLGLS